MSDPWTTGVGVRARLPGGVGTTEPACIAGPDPDATGFMPGEHPAGQAAAPALASITTSVSSLVRSLRAPELSARLGEVVRRIRDPEELGVFAANLASFAKMTEMAELAPDYRTVYGYHRFRADYRSVLLGPPDPGSRPGNRNALELVCASPTPAQELETQLCARFLQEVAVPPEVFGEWAVSAEGVREAIAHELLTPLRALNEKIDGHQVACYRPTPDEQRFLRLQVLEVTRHVAEGGYGAWRFDRPECAPQFAKVSEAAREAWTRPVSRELNVQGRHVEIRKEMGLELFWVTKIGGPSFGFDVGPRNLMALLGNGNIIPIVVRDEQFPDGCLRAFMRLLEGSDGRMTVFLEGTQADFKFNGQSAYAEQLKVEMVRVALEVALAGGYPLNVYAEAWSPTVVRSAVEGMPVQPGRQTFVLEPSASGAQASDYLGPHDWVQLDRRFSRPVSCYVVEATAGELPQPQVPAAGDPVTASSSARWADRQTRAPAPAPGTAHFQAAAVQERVFERGILLDRLTTELAMNLARQLRWVIADLLDPASWHSTVKVLDARTPLVHGQVKAQLESMELDFYQVRALLEATRAGRLTLGLDGEGRVGLTQVGDRRGLDEYLTRGPMSLLVDEPLSCDLPECSEDVRRAAYLAAQALATWFAETAQVLGVTLDAGLTVEP